MAGAAAHKHVHQPEHFEFSPENFEKAKKIIAKYPKGKQQSAVMPLLDIAQRQHDNWLPRAAMDHVASILGMAPVRVYEVASFYTMYNLAPVGKNFIQVCTTTPCWLRGSDEIMKACEHHLDVKCPGSTDDGQFTVIEVECLGACVNAPMAQIGDYFYEDLTPESMTEILKSLQKGQMPKPGPQSKRKSSEPAGGMTSLKNLSFKAAPAPVAAAKPLPKVEAPAAKIDAELAPAAAPVEAEPAKATKPKAPAKPRAPRKKKEE